jgi:formate-dependent nitrite reductase membrane component NrfD
MLTEDARDTRSRQTSFRKPTRDAVQGRKPSEVEASQGGHAYYDVPMLKKPVWKWEVAFYFYLGGLSSGAYLVSRAADRADDKLAPIARNAAYVAAISALPCAPLLISDLGDRWRFHHMLRVFKPRSPMNLGSWILTAYTPLAFLSAARHWLRQREADREAEASAGVTTPIIERDLDRWSAQARGSSLPGLALRVVEDGLGVPLALLLGTYTGVLLSCTATPVWTQNPWLPAVFSVGGFHNGASAAVLAMELDGSARERLREPMEKADLAGSVAEAAVLAGYLVSAAPYAKPVTRGRLGPLFWGGAIGAGLVAPALLKRIGRKRRWARIAGQTLSLLGGLALRWAVLQAGPASATDPEAAREASR